MKQYRVELTQEQRRELETIISKGKAPARTIAHAHVLLKVDKGPLGPAWTTVQVQEAYHVSESLIKCVKRRFVQGGMQDALHRRPQPERPEKRKINGEMEAYLIATTCRPAPQGYRRWSVRLLADRYVELAPQAIEGSTSPSRETIRRALKKNELKPWLRKQWCLPRRGGPDYVAAMEEVLSV
jgi:Homeodomain-like domain